ncbi:hypothetical protein AB0M94_35545 [Streptomyces xanthochromogenes]|uniref:hypothetical protein n=1 Tax=Streptomyces xanthochromogenes TaxID=67384 RepID=UPI0034328E5B
MDQPCPARNVCGTFDRLDAEWAALCADASVQAAVADWLTADHLADDVADAAGAWVRTLGPAQLLAALRPRDGELSDALTDAVLRALLRRAAGQGRPAVLAARIIVQAMVPAAVRMARRLVRQGRVFDDTSQAVVVALYEVARAGRIHTRPGRPAANLTLDTLRRVLPDLARERERLGDDLAAVEECPGPDGDPGARAHTQWVQSAAAAAQLAPAPDAGREEWSQARLELLELVLEAMESGTLSPSEARAIAWHHTATPVPDVRAARLAGTTPGAWQRHRSRAVHRLKSAVRTAA